MVRKIQTLNKKKATLNLIDEACTALPDYSLCDILYSALRKLKPKEISVSWIRDIGDDKLFSAIDNVIIEERK